MMDKKENQTLDGKGEVEKLAVATGASVGIASGTAVVGAATANIAAATAATNASIAAAAASGSVFAPFMVTVTHPATWAVALTNPIAATAVVGTLATLGGLGAYKLIRKALKE